MCAYLPKPPIMIVEVAEELVGAAGALDVELGAAARAVLVGVPDDGGPHVRVGTHVRQTQALHQPEGKCCNL